MDKMREEFEAWAVSTKDQFGVPFFTLKNDSGKYVDHGTEISWQAWQASRQALVVELPPQWEDVCDKVMDSTMVKKSLNDAGIKWTE